MDEEKVAADAPPAGLRAALERRVGRALPDLEPYALIAYAADALFKAKKD